MFETQNFPATAPPSVAIFLIFMLVKSPAAFDSAAGTLRLSAISWIVTVAPMVILVREAFIPPSPRFLRSMSELAFGEPRQLRRGSV